MLQRPPAQGIMATEGEERSMLSEEVYNQLKKMIVSGKFEKGQRLVEEKLVHRVNVSRNPM
jgi:DNA-binding GntR family transcriptional regulator